MTVLTATNITVRRGNKTLVDDASFDLHPGQLTALLGPNGAGKTSLLKTATGIEKPTKGTVRADGANLETLSVVNRAQKLAYLPQARELAWPARVRDVVALGRYAYGVSAVSLGAEDALAIDRALQACDLTELATRHCDSLSGGELARVHCARALAGETPILIADEPTAALDPRHAFAIMALLQSYVRDGGTALVVLHDIALAARHADRLIWMQGGQIVAKGSVPETLTEQRLAEVFGVRAEVAAREVIIRGVV